MDRVTDTRAAALPPSVQLSSGSIEAVKWLAVALMTLDHINKYLCGRNLPMAFELGRIAMPLFVLLMAYHLAQPGALAKGTIGRSAVKLAVFALIASWPYIALANGRLLPLNILFLLLTFALIVLLIEQGGKGRSWLAFGVFLVGGALAEYWWPGLLLALAAWRYFQRPCWSLLAGITASTALLWFINGNFWALAALPLFFAASAFDARIPRTHWLVFYAYYPGHLAALYAIKTLSN